MSREHVVLCSCAVLPNRTKLRVRFEIIDQSLTLDVLKLLADGVSLVVSLAKTLTNIVNIISRSYNIFCMVT